MKVLLHVCCGPCAIYPVEALRREGFEVNGYFHNPNVHPYQEFKRRLQAVLQFSEAVDLDLVTDRNYGLRDFLRQVVFQEDSRCGLCYAMRLQKTAITAREMRVDAFSTTLLYSRYQKHELIKDIGEKISEQYQVPFYYADFRAGWQHGIDRSISMRLHRQSYCGCVYSEQERYDKKFRKRPGGVRGKGMLFL
jgi:predicted adenine nucleotide alpha hydrolase (AANH) superfamily ATPase